MSAETRENIIISIGALVLLGLAYIFVSVGLQIDSVVTSKYGHNSNIEIGLKS